MQLLDQKALLFEDAGRREAETGTLRLRQSCLDGADLPHGAGRDV
jgi:hypothetical protein